MKKNLTKDGRSNICGVRIELRCKELGLKHTELIAQLYTREGIDISEKVMSDIALGKRSVDQDELVAFARILDVSPLWLIEDTDDPTR